MCKRFMNFINHCSTIISNQHVFYKGRSVQSAFLEFTEENLNGFEIKTVLFSFFFNLSKVVEECKTTKSDIRGSCISLP